MPQKKIKKLAKKAVYKFMDVTEHGVGELLPKSKAQKCRDKGGAIIKGECRLVHKKRDWINVETVKHPLSRVRKGKKKYSKPPKRSSY